MDLCCSLSVRFSRKMDLCVSLCWFYMVSNVISERLNITGSSFQKGKYMDSNPLIIIDKIGPIQCIKYCMLHYGCNAVNFKRNDLHCELLALPNSNSSLIDVTGIYFIEISDWEQDKHACWPNPCTGRTKCEAAYYNQYICVTYDTPCSSSQPCYNGGNCRNQFESFLCICPAGYYGTVCEYSYTYIYEATIIESPNYPSNYYDNAVISWSYKTDAGRRISIVADVFNLEENFDWLKVYHRPDKVTELASWTGAQSFTIYSRDNYVYIEFTTDASITSTGFQIVVSTE